MLVEREDVMTYFKYLNKNVVGVITLEFVSSHISGLINWANK
jgi:hypothetical protein